MIVQPIALATTYLHDPLGRAHQVRIRGLLGGEATLDLDHNEGKTGEFGEITFRTQMDYPSIKVTLKPAGEADLPQRGRFREFDIIVPDTDEAKAKWKLSALDGTSLRLAVGAPPCSASRLIVRDGEGKTLRIITMETMTQPLQ